jgi:hypothetical protein
MAAINYREKCLSEKPERCVACGSTDDIQIHHKDADRSNDDIDNLIPLCLSCHSRLHNTNNPPDELKELHAALPKDNLPENPDGSMDRRSIGVKADTKQKFLNLKPEGVTQNLAIKAYLMYAEQAEGRIIGAVGHSNETRCPNCLKKASANVDYYSQYTCENDECQIVHFREE